MSHTSGSPAAQKLCDGCADKYDKMVAEFQSSYRDQRKKDLEKRHNASY
ncbi:MAG: hypothetical protein ACXABY_08975 [Candidatus Thorarchaeota archaeon]